MAGAQPVAWKQAQPGPLPVSAAARDPDDSHHWSSTTRRPSSTDPPGHTRGSSQQHLKGAMALGTSWWRPGGCRKLAPSPPSGTETEANLSHGDTTPGGAGARGPRVPHGHSQVPLWSDSREWVHPEQSRRMLVQSGCRRNLDSYDGQEAPEPSRVAPLDPSGPRERTGRGAGQQWCPALPCDGRAWGPEYGEAARQEAAAEPRGRSTAEPAEPGWGARLSSALPPQTKRRHLQGDRPAGAQPPARPTAATSCSARHSEGAGGAGGSWGVGMDWPRSPRWAERRAHLENKHGRGRRWGDRAEPSLAENGKGASSWHRIPPTEGARGVLWGDSGAPDALCGANSGVCVCVQARVHAGAAGWERASVFCALPRLLRGVSGCARP